MSELLLLHIIEEYLSLCQQHRGKVLSTIPYDAIRGNGISERQTSDSLKHLDELEDKMNGLKELLNFKIK